MTLLGQASGPYEMDTTYTLHTHTESPSSPDSVLPQKHFPTKANANNPLGSHPLSTFLGP